MPHTGVGIHCIYMGHTRVWAHITLAAETGDIKTSRHLHTTITKARPLPMSGTPFVNICLEWKYESSVAPWWPGLYLAMGLRNSTTRKRRRTAEAREDARFEPEACYRHGVSKTHDETREDRNGPPRKSNIGER